MTKKNNSSRSKQSNKSVRNRVSNTSKVVRVSLPSVKAVKGHTGKPVWKPVAGGVRIKHREFVCDLPALSNNDGIYELCQTVAIQPGLPASFPWLGSGIANAFESYIVHDLKYTFEGNVGTDVSGKVFMAIDYDCLDSAPTNKQELMAMQGAARGPIWSDVFTLTADKKALHKFKERYTRDETPTVTCDLKTYDIGNLFVGAQMNNPNGTTSIGELYVDYDIEFRTPQQGKGQVNDEQTATAIFSSNINAGDIFGVNAPNVTRGDQSIATYNRNLLRFKRLGDYIVTVAMKSADVIPGSFSILFSNARSVIGDVLACSLTSAKEAFLIMTVRALDLSVYNAIQFIMGTGTALTVSYIAITRASNENMLISPIIPGSTQKINHPDGSVEIRIEPPESSEKGKLVEQNPAWLSGRYLDARPSLSPLETFRQ